MRPSSGSEPALATTGSRAAGPPRSVVVGAITAVGLVATFSDLLSGTRIPIYRDLLFFTFPFKEYLAERLRAGALPLWNPWILLGTPFLANLQSAVFYPPSLLLLLPAPLGFDLFLFAHYAVALLGTWTWLRGRGLQSVSAATGALTFALGGYLVSLMNLTNHLQSGVWAPIVLAGWQRHLERRSPRSFVAIVAVLSIQVLGGSPESVLMTVTIAAGWTLYDLGRDSRALAHAALHAAAALTLTAAICAVQILPTAEAISQSVRSGALSWGEVSFWSLQPVSLLQLLFPHSSALLPADEARSLGPGFERNLSLLQSIYLGGAPLCLLAAGLVDGRERRYWGTVLAASMVLALGAHTPVFGWLYAALPALFGRFRYPEKFLFAATLAATVLAAEGMDGLITDRRRSERIVAIVAALLGGLAVLICALRWLSPGDYLISIAVLAGKYLRPSDFVSLALDTYWKAQRLALVLAALGAVLWLRRRTLGASTAAVLLLALVTVDLASANRNLNTSVPWAALRSQPMLVDPSSAREQRLRVFHYQVVSTNGGPDRRLTRWIESTRADDDLGKTYPPLWATLYVNLGMVFGVGTTSGGDGLARASDAALLDMLLAMPVERGIALLGVFATGYLAGPDRLDAPSVEPLPDVEGVRYRAYRIVRPRPIAYAATRLEAVADVTETLRRLTDPALPPTIAFVEELPPGWTNGNDGEGAAAVRVLAHSAEHWRLAIDAPRRSLVVLNESYFPGWLAEVDGAPARIHRVNGIVRGVVVEAGRHVVEFAYRPRPFIHGAAVSLASLLVVGVLGIRRARQASAP